MRLKCPLPGNDAGSFELTTQRSGPQLASGGQPTPEEDPVKLHLSPHRSFPSVSTKTYSLGRYDVRDENDGSITGAKTCLVFDRQH
jgi:hypothetical protein